MKNLPDGLYLVTYGSGNNYEKAIVRKTGDNTIGIKSFNPIYSALGYTSTSQIGWNSYKIQKYGIKHYYETL